MNSRAGRAKSILQDNYFNLKLELQITRGGRLGREKRGFSQSPHFCRRVAMSARLPHLTCSLVRSLSTSEEELRLVSSLFAVSRHHLFKCRCLCVCMTVLPSASRPSFLSLSQQQQLTRLIPNPSRSDALAFQVTRCCRSSCFQSTDDESVEVSCLVPLCKSFRFTILADCRSANAGVCVFV